MELQLKDFVLVIDRDGVWKHRKLHLLDNPVPSNALWRYIHIGCIK
jgi:hypothetical protein